MSSDATRADQSRPGLFARMGSRRWRWVVIVLLGAVIAGLSSISDGAPYDPSSLPFPQQALLVLAMVANDVVVWFAITMWMGWLLGRGIRGSAALGACFATGTIVCYLALGSLSAGLPPATMALAGWIVPAAAGGAAAGALGWLARTRPVLWMVLPLLAAARLVMNGPSPWYSPLGRLAALGLVAFGCSGVVTWIIEAAKRRRRG